MELTCECRLLTSGEIDITVGTRMLVQKKHSNGGRVNLQWTQKGQNHSKRESTLSRLVYLISLSKLTANDGSHYIHYIAITSTSDLRL